MPDFPNAPVIGEEFETNNLVYVWDGQKWSSAGGNAIPYLPLAGGQMTGPLHLYADPLAPLEAVPKRYLDMILGAIEGGVEIYGVFDALYGTIVWNTASGMSGNALPPPTVDLEGRYLINSAEGDNPPAGAPLEHYLPGDWLICTGDEWYHIHVATTITADEIALNPQVAGAANVQAGLEAMVPKSGALMTGHLTLNADPVDPFHAATKEYIDQLVGATGIPEAPIDGLQYGRQNATWTQVSVGGGGGIPEAPVDGKHYGRMDGVWSPVLPITGGGLTGFLQLVADPASPLDAATKQYVDNNLGGGGGGLTQAEADLRYLQLTGGTLTGELHGPFAGLTVAVTATEAAFNTMTSQGGSFTGPVTISGASSYLTLNGAPVADAHAATKAYVDSKLGAGGAYLPLTGGALTGHLDGTSATFSGIMRLHSPDQRIGQLQIDDTGTLGAWITGTASDSRRWSIGIGDAAPETGGNAGSDFRIIRYTDNSVYLDTPFGIWRDTGEVSVSCGITVRGDAGGWNEADSITFGPRPVIGDYRAQFYSGFAGAWVNECGFYNNVAQAAVRLYADSSFGYQYGNGIAYKTGGGPWADLSDARIKTVQGDYTPGLAEVLQLRPVVYTYNGNDTEDADVFRRPGQTTSSYDEAVAALPNPVAPYPGSPHAKAAVDQMQFVGLVAQEVEPVFPGMVAQRDGFIDGQPVSDLRTLDTNELIYALVNAVKELSAQNADLSARLAALETPP